jgi:hypothetical protein
MSMAPTESSMILEVSNTLLPPSWKKKIQIVPPIRTRGFAEAETQPIIDGRNGEAMHSVFLYGRKVL